MHSGAAISGFFSGESFKYPNTIINIGMNTPCGLLFLKKKTLADQNVKMATIFKMAAILNIKGWPWLQRITFMSKLHQRKRVHSTLTGKSAVFFKRRKMKISPNTKAYHYPEYHYGCYTMTATNILYFSSMPSVSFVLDHTRLDKGRWSTEEEQCTSTRQMY